MRTSIARSLGLTASVALIVAAANASAGSPLQGAIPRPAGHAKVLPESSQSNHMVGADGRVGVFVELRGEPAARAYGKALAAAGGHGAIATSAAGAASRQAVNHSAAQHTQLLHGAAAAGIHYHELFRASRAMNGVALRVSPKDIAKLARLPGVARVAYLPYETLSNITSVPFIGAPPVWSGSGSLGLPFDATGSGVRIGIIDTGIDYLHPDFGGTGNLADYQKNGDREAINPVDPENPTVKYFPTAKVVGGYDFVGDAYDGSGDPAPDPNPADCNGHGTHVAGSAAGNGVNTDGTPYLAGYDPVPNYAGFRIGPGVAPGASLYALRVFGCGGGTNVLSQAIEWATDPNGDGDLSDHLDVINMSLGAPEGFPSDVDAVAADNAALTGMIVVAAAGNSGDGFFVAGSPAAGKHVIAVAAIADSGIPGTLLHESAPAAGDFPAAAAGFVNPDNSAPPAPAGQGGKLVLVDDGTAPTSDACEGTFQSSVTGKIALIDRGTCNFTVKVLNAQAKGAIGVIVANNIDDPSPLLMGGVADVSITIPAIGVSFATGAALKAQLAGGEVDIALQTADAGDTFAGFSSRGPVIDVDGSVTLKPDLAAPGVNIPSALTGVTCDDAAFFGCLAPALGGYIPGGHLLVLNGTSMATPHVAGLMAVLRQLNPDASADELKARAMNTAAHDVTLGANGSGARHGAGTVGAGRVDAVTAAKGVVTLDNANDDGSTSVTFDVEPTGAQSFMHNVRIVNHSSAAVPVDISIDTVEEAPGVDFSIVPPSPTTLPPGTSTIGVSMLTDVDLMQRACDPTAAKSSSLFDLTLVRECLAEKSALLKVSSGGTEIARLPIYAAIRPHSALASTGMPSGSAPAGTTAIGLVGGDVCTGSRGPGPSCNANLATDEESLVSPFELQLQAARDTNLPGFANLHYVGVNYRPDPGGDDSYLFGLAAYGKWGTPSSVAYNVCVDTDGDGLFDKVVFNTDTGSAGPLFGFTPVPSNGYFTAVLDLPLVIFDAPLNLVGAAAADTGVLDNNVMILGAHLSSLGLAARAKISYGLAVCPAFDPVCTAFTLPSAQCTAADAAASFGPFVYDAAHPGVDGQGNVLLEDLDGGAIKVPYDVSNLGANGSLGMLLLHHHNTQSTTAEVVIVDDLFTDGFETRP